MLQIKRKKLREICRLHNLALVLGLQALPHPPLPLHLYPILCNVAVRPSHPTSSVFESSCPFETADMSAVRHPYRCPRRVRSWQSGYDGEARAEWDGAGSGPGLLRCV